MLNENDIKELQNQIQSLKNDVETLKKEKDDLFYKLRYHQHSGKEDSDILKEASLWLKRGKAYAVDCGAFTAFHKENENLYRGFICVGNEISSNLDIENNRTKNLQVNFELQPDGEPLLNNSRSFIYSLSDAIVLEGEQAIKSVASGQTIFSNNKWDLGDDNSKKGYCLVLRLTNGNDYASTIASNTKISLTLDSAIPASGDVYESIICKTTYLGSSIAPFRRIYTSPGENGGVRFGWGTTGNGQNGLIFMDTDGSLKYKKPDGSYISLGGSSYTFGYTIIQFNPTDTLKTATVPTGSVPVGWYIPQNGTYGTPPVSWVYIWVNGTTLNCQLSSAPGTNNYIAIRINYYYPTS